MSRDIASVISTVRKSAGLSRPKLASMIGVTDRTIKNWEDGVSRPDADLFLDVFYACNKHLLDVMRKSDSADFFSESVSPGEIRQRLIAMIRSETTDDMNRRLLYNLAADHGSDAEAQLNLCTAYNHLSMEDKYDICKLVVERYRLRSEQHRLIRTQHAVFPDLDYLEAELTRVRKEITK